MNIFLDTVGCRLNQSEIEKIAGQFQQAGHSLVGNPQDADMVVINTCAVTSEAASDSRQKARQSARAGAKNIVLTGCWATLDPQSALSLPGVAQVIPNNKKDGLVGEVLHLPSEIFENEPIERSPVPGAHTHTRAFIKVQDGCDNHCTFCITRVARGKGRSRPVPHVLADIRGARSGGAQEIVLSGVHLASWGSDFEHPSQLSELIEAVLSGSDVPRVRLSSIESWDIGDDFFSLWQNARLCRHLHLPLQSGCARILKRMGRRTSPEMYASLIDHARREIPGVAITTDLIVGFPGETDEDFKESLTFVEKMQFAGGHVFSFSSRPGTPADKYPDQIPSSLRKERSAAMRSIFANASVAFSQQFIGCDLLVLWESAKRTDESGWQLEGLTDNYLRVSASSDENLWNKFSLVHIDRRGAEGLLASII